MIIAVVAADGRTGRVFVRRALAAGHIVRAGVRRRSNLHPHQNLTVVLCDATQEEDVRKLLEGAEAVASFIGHVKGSSARVQSNAMRVITKVMHTLKIRRIVSLTGTGARMPGDKTSLLDRLSQLVISFIDPERVKDGQEHIKVLEQSELDWTVIRVVKLYDHLPRSYMLDVNGPGKLLVSRSEVAEACLNVLQDNSFVRQAPIIAKS